MNALSPNCPSRFNLRKSSVSVCSKRPLARGISTQSLAHISSAFNHKIEKPYQTACNLSFRAGISLLRWMNSRTVLTMSLSPHWKPLLSCRTNLLFCGEMNSVSMFASPGLSCDTSYRYFNISEWVILRLICGSPTAFSTPNAWLMSKDLPTPVWVSEGKLSNTAIWRTIALGDTHHSYHQDSESCDSVVSLRMVHHGELGLDSPRTNLEFIVRGEVQAKAHSDDDGNPVTPFVIFCIESTVTWVRRRTRWWWWLVAWPCSWFAPHARKISFVSNLISVGFSFPNRFLCSSRSKNVSSWESFLWCWDENNPSLYLVCVLLHGCIELHLMQHLDGSCILSNGPFYSAQLYFSRFEVLFGSAAIDRDSYSQIRNAQGGWTRWVWASMYQRFEGK